MYNLIEYGLGTMGMDIGEVSGELIDGMQRETLMKTFFQKSFLTGTLISVMKKTLSLNTTVMWRSLKVSTLGEF